jgi:hypothetical protein
MKVLDKFNLSVMTKLSACVAIKLVVNQHLQEYEHQYAREKQPNNMVDVVVEPKVRITIVDDVAVGTNIERTSLLAATVRKKSKIDLVKQDMKAHT